MDDIVLELHHVASKGISPRYRKVAIAAADEIERLRPQPGVIQISLLRRDDGGLRIFSPTHPGLVLSGTEPEKVLACVWPALLALTNGHQQQPQRKHDAS